MKRPSAGTRPAARGGAGAGARARGGRACSTSASAAAGPAPAPPRPRPTRRGALVALGGGALWAAGGRRAEGAEGPAGGGGGGGRPPPGGRLPIQTVKEVIKRDWAEGQYYVTGKLTPWVFAEDCYFREPTQTVVGKGSVERFSNALPKLFDGDSSRTDLISLTIQDEHTLVAKWRLEGALRLPGTPPFKPFTGTTVYKTNAKGYIARHVESWDIPTADAYFSVITGYGSKFTNSTAEPQWVGAPPAPPLPK